MVEKVREIATKITEDHNELIKKHTQLCENEKAIQQEKATIKANLHRLAGAMSVVNMLEELMPSEEHEEEIITEDN